MFSFEDYQTIYALDLEEIITGERLPTQEEQLLLLQVASGLGFSGEPSDLMQVLAFLGAHRPTGESDEEGDQGKLIKVSYIGEKD